MNQVTMYGRLTKDPELRFTTAGKAKCTFTIAVDRDYKDSKGNKGADFFNVVVWGKIGESCANYLTKGREAIVQGSMENRSYEKKDGGKGYITEIKANKVHFVGGKGTAPQFKEVEIIDDDDVPF